MPPQPGRPVLPPPLRVPVAHSPVETANRPGVIDYFCLCAGVVVSLGLAQWSGLYIMPAEHAPAPGNFERLLDSLIPFAALLPVGIVLFWPIFFLTQLISGRRQGVSSAEWLLWTSWLLFIVLAVWLAFKNNPKMPAGLATEEVKALVLMSYILYMVSMAALALVLWLIDLFMRYRQPWTQALTIVLMVWTLVPISYAGAMKRAPRFGDGAVLLDRPPGPVIVQ